jgi:flagellar motor switch protein FliG
MSVQEQSLSGVEKASVLLLSLGASKSAQVFKHLTDAEIEDLSAKIMGMRSLEPATMKSVMGEFERVRADRAAENAGRNFTMQALQRALGKEKADQVVRKTTRQSSSQRFGFLLGMDCSQVARILSKENEQIAALVLVHLPTETSGAVLAKFGDDAQSRIAIKICKMDSVDPEVVNAVEEGLRTKLSSSTGRPSGPLGPKRLAEILSSAARSTENAVLSALRTGQTGLDREVREMIFAFEDLGRLTDESIRAALREIPNDDLKLALIGADDEIRQAIFHCMSDRSAGYLQEDLDRIGPARIKDIEAAQERIVALIRRQITTGEAKLWSREEEMVA